MNGFDWGAFGVVTLTSLLAIAVGMAVTATIGVRIGRHNVVDVSWGAGFVLIALVSAIVGTGDLWRRLLMLALVAIWGLRLATHMAIRSRGKGEDPRYEEMLGRATGNRTLYAIRKIYLTQGISLWFVSLPIQVAAVSNGSFGLLVVLGIALWIVGVTFETVGDRQMEEFKSDPGSRGHIMDQGLWAWTRASQLFRRRVCLVGDLPRLGVRVAGGVDRPLTDRHDVLPGLRHRSAVARATHGTASGLSRVSAADKLLHSSPAESPLRDVGSFG